MKVEIKGIIFFIIMLPITLLGQVKVSGYVKDNKAPLTGVNVSLHRIGSDFIKAVITDSLGYYEFEGIEKGSYRMVVSPIGYLKQEAVIEADTENLELPDLLLEEESIVMNEVIVKAKRSAVKIEQGKMTFDVSAVSLGANGSLLSVLGKIPGILIQNDGTVILNGQPGAKVMIDGKLTYLSGENLVALLRSMPSDAADQIEMITQPSAKYDADGAGGLINIKKKQKNKAGLDIALSLNAEAGKCFRENQSFSVNFQKNKFKYYNYYTFFDGQDFVRINSSRYYTKKNISDPISVRLDMKADRMFSSQSHYFKTGAEYEFSEKITADIHFQGNFFGRNKDENARSDFSENQSLTDLSLLTANIQEVDNRNLGIAAGILYKMNTRLKWENVVNFLGFKQKEELDQKSSTLNSGAENSLQGKMNGEIHIINMQSGLVYNKSEKFNFQSGAKLSLVNIDNNALYNSLESGLWIPEKKLSSGFAYKEKIIAGYLQTSQKWSERFSTQAGLRYEHTYTRSQFTSYNRDSTLIRSYKQFFPAVSASYIAAEGHTLSLQYGRRIIRPNYRDLNPFTEVNDFYLQERGNTALRPELLDNFEASWLLKSNYLFSLFYMIRINPITKSYLTEPQSDATIVMPLNLKESYAAGLKSSINNIKPAQWWTVFFNGSLTYKQFHWIEEGKIYKNALFSPSLQFSNQFVLPENWAVEFTGYFNGRTAEGQARIGAIGSASIGARKSFFDNKLNIYVYVNDIFLSQRQKIRIQNSVITGEYQELRDSRMAGINLRWSLNSGKSFKTVRKVENSEESKRINY